MTDHPPLPTYASTLLDIEQGYREIARANEEQARRFRLLAQQFAAQHARDRDALQQVAWGDGLMDAREYVDFSLKLDRVTAALESLAEERRAASERHTQEIAAIRDQLKLRLPAQEAAA